MKKLILKSRPPQVANERPRLRLPGLVTRSQLTTHGARRIADGHGAIDLTMAAQVGLRCESFGFTRARLQVLCV